MSSHPRRWLRLVAATLALSAGALAQPLAAGARIATSGSGRFLDTIDWLEWGSPFEVISGAGTVARTRVASVGGVDLVVGCSLTKFGGIALAYRPGDWHGDALDELYGMSGTETANTLISGITNPGDATNLTTTLQFACSATLGGQPFALGGLVVADAEQSIEPERVQASIAAQATWRIIDRLRSPGCDASTVATATDTAETKTLVLAGAELCATGPAVVAYADGATSGTAAVYSPPFGRSAVALGIWVPVDLGDAPLSYGEAGHALDLALAGGDVPAPSPTLVSDDAFTLATPTAPATRLGDSVDPGGGTLSENASGDDVAGTGGTFGAADDETEHPPLRIDVVAGSSFTHAGVACTGPGFVAGWIDFDASGSFDADERSETAPCDAESVDLAWTVPADAVAQGRTFERLRIAAREADVAGPTGFAASGEVEDHSLTLAVSPRPQPPAPAPAPAPPLPGEAPAVDLLPLASPLPAASTTGSGRTAAPAPSPAPAPAPEPHQGKSVAIAESTGTVRVRVPGSTRFVDLARLTEVPLGSRIDAREGKATITVEVDARTGATQTGTFFRGIFVVTQTRGPKPVLVLTLAGGSFADCSTTPATRSILGAASSPVPFQFAARKRSKRKVRRLWGKGKGDFRSTGVRSSATVRGTYWLVEDRCDGTYTRVRRGIVDVRDFGQRKTVRLQARKRYLYLAKAR